MSRLLAAALLAALPFLANAQPAPRVVMPGNASLSTSPGAMPGTITWQGFSIGAEAAKTGQPAAGGSAAVLNRLPASIVTPQLNGVVQPYIGLSAGTLLQGVQVQPAMRGAGSATEAVRTPDGRIVFRATQP